MAQWPKREDIEKVLKKLDGNPDQYTRVISEDAPVADRIKRDICAEFVIYKREHNLNPREFAQKLGVSEELVGKILRYRFYEITLDRLIQYLEVLGIKFEFKKVV